MPDPRRHALGLSRCVCPQQLGVGGLKRQVAGFRDAHPQAVDTPRDQHHSFGHPGDQVSPGRERADGHQLTVDKRRDDHARRRTGTRTEADELGETVPVCGGHRPAQLGGITQIPSRKQMQPSEHLPRCSLPARRELERFARCAQGALRDRVTNVVRHSTGQQGRGPGSPNC